MSASPGIKRVVEISRPSHLRLKDAQLVIEQDGTVVGTVPAEDLGLLMIDDQSVVMTTGALSACWQHDAPVVLCDRRHLPAALLLPMVGHSLLTATLSTQISATTATKRRLWKAIVRGKLLAQDHVLRNVGKDVPALRRLASRVANGDPSNLEAQGARLYWQSLFGTDFRRDPDSGEGINALLNYGYAVLRAVLARSICAAGLHPALGIQHRNQYNAFCLADDLMEPLRPMVDQKVRELSQQRDAIPLAVNRSTKRHLLEIVSQPVTINGQQKPLMAAAQEYVASIRRVLARSEKVPVIPSL